MQPTDPGDHGHAPTRLTVAVGVGIILALTLVLAAGVGGLLFDLDPQEPGPPEVLWDLEDSDPPVLTHVDGESVECDRLFVGGELGSGLSLCEYFDSDIISEGDSAELMPIDGESGSIVLEWYDAETDQLLAVHETFQLGTSNESTPTELPD